MRRIIPKTILALLVLILVMNQQLILAQSSRYQRRQYRTVKTEDEANKLKKGNNKINPDISTNDQGTMPQDNQATTGQNENNQAQDQQNNQMEAPNEAPNLNTDNVDTQIPQTPEENQQANDNPEPEIANNVNTKPASETHETIPPQPEPQMGTNPNGGENIDEGLNENPNAGFQDVLEGNDNEPTDEPMEEPEEPVDKPIIEEVEPQVEKTGKQTPTPVPPHPQQVPPTHQQVPPTPTQHSTNTHANTATPEPTIKPTQHTDWDLEEEAQKAGFDIDKYLNEYEQSSQVFYKWLEDVLIPAYRTIKGNMYLTFAVSVAVTLYILKFITSILGSLCSGKKRSGKLIPGQVVYSEVNENFRKFTQELDELKRQMAEIVKVAGGSAPSLDQKGAPTTVTAGIPQEFKKEIANISASVAKNEEMLNKFLKEKKQLNTFLADFQKEVVESHKTIWKELATLRTVFSTKNSISSITPKVKKQSGFSIDGEKSHSRRSSVSSLKSIESKEKVDETSTTKEHTDIEGTRSDSKQIGSRQALHERHKTMEPEAINKGNSSQLSEVQQSRELPKQHIKSKSEAPQMKLGALNHPQSEPKQIKVNEPPQELNNSNPEPNTISQIKSEGAGTFTIEEEKAEKNGIDSKGNNEEVGSTEQASPFNPLPNGGMKPNIVKPGITPVTRNLPIPQMRRPGPGPQGNPFNRANIPRPNIPTSGVSGEQTTSSQV